MCAWFFIDVIGWEQTERIKCDFSAQFIPFFDWLKKNMQKSEQNGTEQK
jgi:hypothetical protein